PTPRNVTFLAGSAEDLPLEDRSVDLVVSALSAHHREDLAAAVVEIRRVPRARGTARIYDVRFATYTGEELADVRDRLRLSPSELVRTVLQRRRFLAPYALIEVTPQRGAGASTTRYAGPPVLSVTSTKPSPR
ncbi:MAG TPA: methyltransferase domain-containing protein, partial [Clostridia bacterium]|nr:methyltransferase domain-containing protein [Clostridia bacterium]